MLLAIFFMILLSLIGITLIGMVPVELKTATRTKLDVQAHYAATAAIRRARTWCQAVMTPDRTPSSPDYLGEDPTWNNTYCNYLNEITAVPASNPDFLARPLSGIIGANLIPMNSTRWGSDIFKALNLPAGSVDPDTVCLVSKLPLTFNEWQVYTVIVPDIDTPGGKNTLNGSGQVVRQFGGAGDAGQRCYQVICLAYYQGFPVVRAKSVFLESSFARYSLFVNADPENTWYLTATAGQQSTEGPVHTNSYFRFALNSNLWADTSGKIPFRSDMSFAQRPGAAVAPGLDYDGALYYRGNDANGTSTDYRPFETGAEDARYRKMLENGRGALRQTASPIALPPDNSPRRVAAYGATNGQTFSTAVYSDAALGSHLDAKGIFVMGQGTSPGQVAGGVVVKGHQRRMFLEAVGANGLPYGLTGGESNNIASGSIASPTVNPAIRVQAETAITKQLWSTSAPFQTSTSTNRTRSSITQTTISTSRSASRSLTSTQVFYSTTTLGTYSTYTTSGGGAGGVVQTTSSFVSTGKTSNPTSTASYYTTYSTPSISTSTSWSPWTTQYSTFNTQTSVVTASASWKPIDQVIETKNVPITLSPASFTANQWRFASPAGAQGSGANMDQYTITNNGTATTGYTGFTQFLIKEGNNAPVTLTSGSTTIPVDKVVVLKQSRSDPQTAVVFLMDRGGGLRSEGDPVLNGAVYHEGNIGGLAGVNVQRQTIAGQINEPGGATPGDPLDQQPGAPSATLNIRNNLWQYGTNPKNSDANIMNKPVGAESGLGLVAEWINVNTRPGDFSTYASGLLSSNNQVLTIYATMLAGRKNADSTYSGGFTVGVNGPQSSINGITYGNMGNSNNTPMMRTVGGLIVANWFARLNLINRAGWNSQAAFDQQLANSPPPWFPKDGSLNPLTYVEERVWASQNL